LDLAGNEIGHFAQVIWANSNIVACGISLCKDVTKTTFPFTTIIVCDYKPLGNFLA
jgi:hypothetical protein